MTGLWGCQGYFNADGTAGATTGGGSGSNGSGKKADAGGKWTDGGPGGKGDQWGDTGTWSKKDTSSKPNNCKSKAQDTLKVFNTYCSQCHGPGSPGRGGFSTIMDASKLKSSGKVNPYNPKQSAVYTRMKKNEMPPKNVTNQPSGTDLKTVKEWINCGAPLPTQKRKFKTIDKKLRQMEKDLIAIRNPADRAETRYVSLTHLYNGKMKKQKLQAIRESLFFTLNSLSKGRTIVLPDAIDADKTIYRIELDDYGWDAQTWERIISDYPYAVSYDQNSQLFPYNEGIAERLRDETETEIPYVQADWLITHVTQAPLYYDILELPARLSTLEQQLNVDISENIRNEQVERAGFNDSGVSEANRVIERHDLPGGFGAFWVSYDFANSVGQRNIFSNPLDFREDGGEFIFTLDNGLQAYYISNAAGTRLNKAPNTLVTDSDRPDNQVQAGLSCMGCHNSDGIIPKSDEIRAHARKNLSGQEKSDVLALYPPKKQFDASRKKDAQIFQQAKKSTGVKATRKKPVMSIALEHEESLTLEQVAQTLGIKVQDLNNELRNGGSDLPPEILSLRNKNSKIPRETFEGVFNQLVCALGLGDPLQAPGATQTTSGGRFPGRRRGGNSARVRELDCSNILN